MKKIILKDVQQESSLSSSFPAIVRFYFSERNLLEYKESGAIPFFIKFFDDFTLENVDVEAVETAFKQNRRLGKGFLFEKFYLYKMPDFGAQSLSSSMEDFIPICFDSEGYKIRQRDILFIKNYTSKETFVLVPKTKLSNNEKINIEVVMKDEINRDKQIITLNRGQDGKFKFNANNGNLGINSFDDIAVALDSSFSNVIPASKVFISFTPEAFPSNSIDNTYIAKQETYFKKLQGKDSSLGDDKKRLSLEITVNENLGSEANPVNTIYIRSRQSEKNYYYDTYTGFRQNNIFSSIFRRCFIADVYKETPSGLTHLIPGIDYYLDDSGLIYIIGSNPNDLYEIFLKEDTTRRIIIPFRTTTGYSGGFDIKKALYESHIVDWNVDLNKTDIKIFENGLLKQTSNDGETYSEYSFEASTGSLIRKYAYVLEDIVSLPNLTGDQGSNLNVVYLHDENPNVFTQFNSYQISTDPYFLTCGETSPLTSLLPSQTGAFVNQEVYLYDSNLNFKIDESELKVKTALTGTLYTVNDVLDPYAGLTSDEENLGTYQNTRLAGILKTNETTSPKVQAIESSISRLKENLISIVNNSSLTYSSANPEFVSGDFMFLIVKDVVGLFDLIYYDSSDNIIKREYSCECTGSGNIYISVPYFNFSKVRVAAAHQNAIATLGSYKYYSFK